eukprot:1120362-Rhodomonas_salina.2
MRGQERFELAHVRDLCESDTGASGRGGLQKRVKPRNQKHDFQILGSRGRGHEVCFSAHRWTE